MSNQGIVSIVRCTDYSSEAVDAAVAESMDLAGLSHCFDGQPRILLKPNLLSTRRPDEAVTTHPSVISAAGRFARALGCSLSVGDSPPFAGESSARYARLCETTGAAAAAAELGAGLVRFEEGQTTIAHPSGRFYRSFDIAQAVLDADLIVNIPKLKTHGLTLFTGAVKNVFGCVPGLRKGLFHVQASEDHEVFSQMLVDLLQCVKPAVNVMDAVVAMEGDGPNAGVPRHVGLIMASADPVALDAVACAVVGVNPLSVDTTRLAHELGVGCGDLSRIEILGQRIEDVLVPDFRPSSGSSDWLRIPAPIRRFLRRQLVARPRIDADKCTGCGDCIAACPVKAITSGRPPVIDLGKCIRCYCCHEVCNFAAAKLTRGFLARMIQRGREKR